MLIGTILVVIIIGIILQIMIILMKTPMVKLLVIKIFFNIVKEIEKIVKITWIHNMREINFSPNKWKNIFLF